jgi:hypothetical protein
MFHSNKKKHLAIVSNRKKKSADKKYLTGAFYLTLKINQYKLQ